MPPFRPNIQCTCAVLSGFFPTKPLIISSIPDTPLIPFAAHYVQAAKV